MMKNALIGFMKNKGRLKIHQMLMLKVGQDFLNIDLKRLLLFPGFRDSLVLFVIQMCFAF